MTLATPTVPVNLPTVPVDELLTRFETDDYEAVRSFLLADTEAARTLAESVPELETVFGENVSVFLEPVVDPESDDRPVVCALVQVFDRDIKAALTRRDAFCTRWFQQSEARMRGGIVFDVEMR